MFLEPASQCFVRVITPPGNTRPNRSRNKARKPLYLDVTNWFLLTAFERSMAAPESRDTVVIFEEALPELSDAPRYGEHGQRATEYIIELSAGRVTEGGMNGCIAQLRQPDSARRSTSGTS